MNIDQMKLSQFLYFESHKKIIKTAMYTLLFVSVPHLQYQHILLTRVFRRNERYWVHVQTMAKKYI